MTLTTKLKRVVYIEELPSQSHKIPWSRGLARSEDKLNTLYLKAYGH